MIDAEIAVVADPKALANEAAGRFADLAQEAAASRGRFSVALSGGSTPGALYRLLAGSPYRDQVPWEQVHLFWGDERCVPPDDPGSNFHLANETLIAHVPLLPDHVHRVLGELEPKAAARAYDLELQDFFCGPRTRFDLVLLGMGIDGHTASLFPGSTALQERQRLAVAVAAQYQDRPASRVTLTLPALNTARQVLFLVTGSAKASVVQAVLQGPAPDGSGSVRADDLLPAQQIRPVAGKLTWLIDAAAASQLGR
jgi:6-phosphogluconolactonase